ncbi:VOC family protein [Aureibaculum algae]|uniref:VOC family protein n=1 Tax=Aureibaculum algae TaxID=2584122 RepID=A0A5B7TPK4_9FLAO|nr:VOC family protein [Aureibaculum algae]QCX38150.1 VOC family protein [Aureibaculum algae]
MATINTYLNFNGNCEAAFNFYKSVFGGEFIFLGRFEEMPEGDGYKVTDSDKNKIMHVSLPIGKTILMGSDTVGDWGPKFVQGNNFSVSITPENTEEADKLFKGLSAGGHITMPMENTFWGSYFGMLTDKFGINWMVNLEQSQA